MQEVGGFGSAIPTKVGMQCMVAELVIEVGVLVSAISTRGCCLAQYGTSGEHNLVDAEVICITGGVGNRAMCLAILESLEASTLMAVLALVFFAVTKAWQRDREPQVCPTWSQVRMRRLPSVDMQTSLFDCTWSMARMYLAQKAPPAMVVSRCQWLTGDGTLGGVIDPKCNQYGKR